ncbi:hypothetical protein EBZ38_13410 [bacterium]|nr:hypothetical protein [bacterium]
MTAPRLNQVIGFLAKEESTYGTNITLSTSADAATPYIGDGDPEPPAAYDYVFDGSVGRGSGTLLPVRRATPSGRSMAGTFTCLPKGLGSAYSASAFPPIEVHRFLKAAGLDAAYSASPSHQWLYTPTAYGTTFTSLTLRQYAQGSIYELAGTLCDWSFETQGVGVPIWTFPFRGVGGTAPTDAALPALTHEATSIVPPIASAVVENLGSFTSAVIRRVAFRLNRNVDTTRVALDVAGGHRGFIPGNIVPELELEIERPERSTYDPEATFLAGTSAAVDVTFGTVQYNRYKISLPQAQLTSVTPGAEGSLATVTLVYRGFATTPAANDALQVLFN